MTVRNVRERDITKRLVATRRAFRSDTANRVRAPAGVHRPMLMSHADDGVHMYMPLSLGDIYHSMRYFPPWGRVRNKGEAGGNERAMSLFREGFTLALSRVGRERIVPGPVPCFFLSFRSRREDSARFYDAIGRHCELRGTRLRATRRRHATGSMRHLKPYVSHGT